MRCKPSEAIDQRGGALGLGHETSLSLVFYIIPNFYLYLFTQLVAGVLDLFQTFDTSDIGLLDSQLAIFTCKYPRSQRELRHGNHRLAEAIKTLIAITSVISALQLRTCIRQLQPPPPQNINTHLGTSTHNVGYHTTQPRTPDPTLLPRRRIETDVMKMYVTLEGARNQLPPPFQGGIWKVHVELPDQYPYKSPSIGFVNRIFHPNIDELSGSVCLDVINQTWSPMFDMINIFEVFLPQLLRYPNPTDPLNGEAAALLMREPKSYDAKVKVKYASKDAADEAGAESDDDDDMSSVGSFGDEDEEPAGQMEEV
ncbi:hypothetical protein G7Y89_g5259 [Cudoniella acicularis]|uniref:Ubiquitin-conjugating enzyme E2 H n=1 Tax=Cudoniella acicularis TaxID=354080 RepID=A0A8H4RMU0_9HELO|nr:hypothetical protein G7Y89_g5259 [Cudoniella acicularis]